MNITQRLSKACLEIQRLEKEAQAAASTAGELFRQQSDESLLPTDRLNLQPKIRQAFEEKERLERELHTARVQLKQVHREQQQAVEAEIKRRYLAACDNVAVLIAALNVMADRREGTSNGLVAPHRIFLPSLDGEVWLSSDSNRCPWDRVLGLSKHGEAMLDLVLAELESNDIATGNNEIREAA